VSGALQAWWRGECAAQPGSGMYATRVVEAPPGGSALPAEMRLTCKQDSQAPWAEVARAARFGPEESERRAHQAVGLRSCSMHRSRNLERVRTVRVAVLLFRIQAAGRAASTCVQAVLCTACLHCYASQCSYISAQSVWAMRALEYNKDTSTVRS